jgi:hypothetical protein
MLKSEKSSLEWLQGVSPLLLDHWFLAKKKWMTHFYVIHIEESLEEKIPVCVYRLNDRMNDHQQPYEVKFDMDPFVPHTPLEWTKFQSNLPTSPDTMYFILCRTKALNLPLKKVFLPIQSHLLSSVKEFSPFVKDTLGWKEDFSATLSFSTQYQIIQEIVTLTHQCIETRFKTEYDCADTLHQLLSYKDSYDSTKVKRLKINENEEEEDKKEEHPFPTSFKRLHDTKWNQLPPTFQQNLLDCNVFKESQMGGLQRPVVQVYLTEKSSKTGKIVKKRKHETSSSNTPAWIIPQDLQERKQVSKLVNRHIDITKEVIRSMITPGYKKTFPSSLTLVVQKPRVVKKFSRFYWQKDAWLKLLPEQQEVIVQRVKESLS